MGAKQAFARKYNRRAWKENIRARWLENVIRRNNEPFAQRSSHVKENRQEVKEV